MPGGKKSVGHASDKNVVRVSPISSRTRSGLAPSSVSATLSGLAPSTASATHTARVRTARTTKSAHSRLKSGPPCAAKSSAKSRLTMASNKVQPMDTAEDNSDMGSHGNKDQNKANKDQSEADLCAVCMCPPELPKTLDKCGHIFCTTCIEQCFKKMNPVCPICGTVYGRITGNMPQGTMSVDHDTHTIIPGYSVQGVIVIYYTFPNGTQTAEHPHPGRQYFGTHRVAYLPNNTEGKKVCDLLRRSFENRMTFTVGRSATTGLDDQVIWNDIHHKTKIHGGPTSFGYPDPTYLTRVQQELAAKGIS